MSTVANKKTGTPRKKKTSKVKSIGKQYNFSSEERAIYAMISAKNELANEKEKSACEIRQTAQMLQQEWLNAMLAKRSISTSKKINVDVDKGIITVMENK